MGHHHHKKHKSSCHDTCENGKYEKRCYCEKCVKKYDEWCKVHPTHKDKKCVERKCVTICEYRWQRPCAFAEEGGFKKKFETKWEKYDGPVPDNCHNDC